MNPATDTLAVIIVLGTLFFVGATLLGSMIKILREYERGVVFRLGRFVGVRGPGLVILIPAIERMVRADLDELLAKREHLNQILQEIVDRHTDPWGVKVAAVEVKDVQLPETMRRAMAKQAEAERERRAKVIHAQGEFEASEQLSEAARVLSGQSISLQLRFLQTLTEVAAEKNSTLIFPVPIDLFKPFLKSAGVDTE